MTPRPCRKKTSRPRARTDGGLVPKILAYLQLRGIWAWRANSGAVMKANGVPIAMSPAGTPDVMLVLPGGRLAGIEAKSRTGKQSATQKAWQARAGQYGVRYAVARSMDDVVSIISRWLSEVSDA